MALSSSAEFSATDQACEAGEQFYKVFYENFDRRRSGNSISGYNTVFLGGPALTSGKQLLGKLFLENATMVWNGNPVSGSSSITEFFEKLPVSEHVIDTLDCQPITAEMTDNQTSVLVVTSGKVTFEGNRKFPFTQNFILTKTPTGVWKIASNSFRYEE